MEFLLYIAKGSIILSIFWVVYMLFLKRETFFGLLRYYFLSGIILSFGLPLVYFTPTVSSEVAAASEQLSAVFVTQNVPLTQAVETSAKIDFATLLWLVYGIGIFILGIRLIFAFIKLQKFLRKSDRVFTLNGIRHIETSENILPFSYLNSVVYNPTLHDSEELEHILKHEYAHIQNSHSLDLTIAHFLCIFHWFNPLAWQFKKSLNRNLEFMADTEASKTISNLKEYQYCLVKNSLATQHSFPVNQFYQPFLKTRIMMLQKTKSKPVKALKLALTIPFLFLFVIGFQTQTTAQITEFDKETTEEIETVAFINIEQVPIYPGCENLATNDEKKSCMNHKIQTLIHENFGTSEFVKDSTITGVQRINLEFTVNEQGDVEEIKSKAEYPALIIEAIRVVKLIPHMEPGKQRDKPVKVSYTIPIIFQLQ